MVETRLVTLTAGDSRSANVPLSDSRGCTLDTASRSLAVPAVLSRSLVVPALSRTATMDVATFQGPTLSTVPLFDLDFKNGRYRQTSSGVTTETTNITVLNGYSYTRAGAKVERSFTGGYNNYTANTPAIIPGVGYWARQAFNNPILQSQDFSSASWTKTALSVTANSITAPDGTLTADKLTEDATNNPRYVTQTMATTNGTCSVWAKMGTRRYLYFICLPRSPTDSANQAYCFFDLQNGAVTQQPGGSMSATIEDYGGGWYRCTATGIVSTSTSREFRIGMSNANSVQTYTGDGVSTVYLWQAQMTTTVNCPIIPTTTTAVSVGNDDMQFTVPSVTDRDMLLLCVANYSTTPVGSQSLIGISDNSLNNYINMYRGSDGSQRTIFTTATVGVINVGGGTQFTGTGRSVFAVLYRATKVTPGRKTVAGSSSLGSESSAISFPTGLSRIQIGNIQATAFSNAPIEYIGIKFGTFTDAEVLKILGTL